MRRPTALLLFAVAALIHPGESGAQEPVGKVAVAATGAVSFDGRPVTVEALKGKLADLKRRNGVVWYYREAAGQEPPSEATAVIRLIIEHQLPVSMSTKPDYSDVVVPDGTTRPRDGRSRAK